MRRTRFTMLATAAALMAALSAHPADAQGKSGKGEKQRAGHSQQQGKGRGTAKAQPSERRGSTARAARPRTERAERPKLARSSRQGSGSATKARSSGATRTRDVSRDVPAVGWDRDYERRTDRSWSWDDERYRRSTRRHRDVPPGWCQGVGNPHNTIANCGYGANRYDSRYGVYRDDDGTYRDRDTRYGSYQEAHEAFHRSNDRVCRDRASERPFDPAYQLQVRRECSAEHDRWHDRYDPNADPSWSRIRLPF